MDKRATSPQRVTSPTWGPPPPCKTGPKTKFERNSSLECYNMTQRIGKTKYMS